MKGTLLLELNLLVIVSFAVALEAEAEAVEGAWSLLQSRAKVVAARATVATRLDEDPGDICRNILIQSEANSETSAEFMAYCQSRNLDKTVCEIMMQGLGAHPWKETTITQVCARPDVSEMFGVHREMLAKDSPVAFCNKLVQGFESAEMTPATVGAYCKEAGIGMLFCRDLLVRLGPHPWTATQIDTACEAESSVHQFAAKESVVEQSCLDIAPNCADLVDTCESNKEWMQTNCPVSCSFCTNWADAKSPPAIELKSAWNAPFVEVACMGIGGVTALIEDEDLTEEEEMQPSMAHWSVRRFNLNRGFNATMGYYASADIEADVPSAATMAVISFHGAMRNAIDYFCTLRKIMLTNLGKPSSSVMMIVPKFFYPMDRPDPRDVWWNASKPWGDYRVGANSDRRSGGEVSSFDAVDRIVELLADKDNYPSLQEIVFMGHSAGGQTVQRYALTTHMPVPLAPHLDVRFAIANPSSYTYLDDHRWGYDCNEDGCSEPEYLPYDRELGRTDYRAGDRRRRRALEGGFGFVNLGSPEGKKFVCRSYVSNDWGYGFNWNHISESFVVPYIAEHEDIRGNLELYKRRNIIYLVGQNDTCTDDTMPYGCDPSCWTRDVVWGRYDSKCYRNRMDMRCEAMLMGWNRNIRGKLYLKHLEQFYGEKVHELHEIPDTGHEGEAMFMHPIAQAALFSKEVAREAAVEDERLTEEEQETRINAKAAQRVKDEDADRAYKAATKERVRIAKQKAAAIRQAKKAKKAAMAAKKETDAPTAAPSLAANPGQVCKEDNDCHGKHMVCEANFKCEFDAEDYYYHKEANMAEEAPGSLSRGTAGKLVPQAEQPAAAHKGKDKGKANGLAPPAYKPPPAPPAPPAEKASAPAVPAPGGPPPGEELKSEEAGALPAAHFVAPPALPVD